MSTTSNQVQKSKLSNPLAEQLQLKLSSDELTNCMRCGFCLPACPTYRETGYEAASPRGRIALMKAVTEGLMEPDAAFKQQLDLCLGCRACEPVCPSDVKYGQLLEQARAAIEDHAEHRWWIKLIRSVMFRHTFPNQNRVKLLGLALQVYQKSGLRRLSHKLGVMKMLPDHMRGMESIMPEASRKGVVEQLGTLYPAKGETIARVGMFRGCIMDILFTETNINTVKLLSEAGFEVVIPERQNCCGALHAHSGEKDVAKRLARDNIKAFKAAGVDYIVSNAGGCGALLIEYDHLLHDDPEWADEAKWFADRVKDVSQIVVEQGRIPRFGANADEMAANDTLTITYQDSCHLRNVMRSGNAPRQLMKQIVNVQFVELTESERCCGSAGIYNITQPQMAGDILQHKMEHVKDTQARYLLSSNPGCLLQMKLGIQQHGASSTMKAVHIVDFLYDRIQRP